MIRKREEKEKKFKRLTSASGSAGSLADAGLAVGGEGMPFHGVPLRDGIVQEVKAPHGERGPSHVLPHHPVLRGLREPLALKPRGQSLGVKTFNIYVAAYQILEKKKASENMKVIIPSASGRTMVSCGGVGSRRVAATRRAEGVNLLIQMVASACLGSSVKNSSSFFL